MHIKRYELRYFVYPMEKVKSGKSPPDPGKGNTRDHKSGKVAQQFWSIRSWQCGDNMIKGSKCNKIEGENIRSVSFVYVLGKVEKRFEKDF